MPPAPRSQTDGPLLHVREHGADGPGPPLVLIHGLGTTGRIWSLVAPQLAAHRPTVTLDLPGFGASAPAGRGFELDAVADRVARGLAAHRIKGPFDVVGHSLGGAVALTLAAIRPRSVRRLVLVAPAGLRRRGPMPLGPLSPGVEGWFAGRRRLARLTDLAWGRRALLAFAVADGARLSPGQARMVIQASDGASRIGPAFATVARADLRPLLHRVSAPLGLIWAEHDRTIPSRTARLVLDERPQTPLEIIEGAGHVPMIERPRAFAVALRSMLQKP